MEKLATDPHRLAQTVERARTWERAKGKGQRIKD